MWGWWRWALVSQYGVAPSGWSVFLPLLIFPCSLKSRSSLLAPAHRVVPEKGPLKRLWWCGDYNSENYGRCISLVSAMRPMHATFLFKKLHTERFAIAQMTFNSLKVTGDVGIPWITYDFLLMFPSNYVSIMSRGNQPSNGTSHMQGPGVMNSHDMPQSE